MHFLGKRKFAFGNEACQPLSLYQAEKAIWNPLQTHIFPFKTTEEEKREAAPTQAANSPMVCYPVAATKNPFS